MTAYQVSNTETTAFAQNVLVCGELGVVEHGTQLWRHDGVGCHVVAEAHQDCAAITRACQCNTLPHHLGQ